MWNPPYVYMPSRPWQGFQAGQGHPPPPVNLPQPQLGVGYQHPSHTPVPLMDLYHQPRPPNTDIRWNQPTMTPQQHPAHFASNFPRQPIPPGVEEAELRPMMGHQIPGQLSRPTMHIQAQTMRPGVAGVQHHPIRPHPVPGQVPNYPIPGQVPNYPIPGQVPNYPIPGQVSSAPPNPGQASNYPIPGQLPNAPPIPGQLPNAPPIPGQLPNAPPNPGQASNYPIPGQLPNAPPIPGQLPNAPPNPGQASNYPIPGQLPNAPPIPGQLSNAPPIPGHRSNVPPIPGHRSNIPPIPNKVPSGIAPPLPGQMPNAPPIPMHMDVQTSLSASGGNQYNQWGQNIATTPSTFVQQNPTSSYQSSLPNFNLQSIHSYVKNPNIHSTSTHTSEHHTQKQQHFPDSCNNSSQSNELRKSSTSDRRSSLSTSTLDTSNILSQGTEKIPLKIGRRDLTFTEIKSQDKTTKHSPNKNTHSNHSSKSDHKSRPHQREQVSPRKRESHQSPSNSKHISKKSRPELRCGDKQHRNDLKMISRSHEDGKFSPRKTKNNRSDIRNCHQDKQTSGGHDRSGSSHSQHGGRTNASNSDRDGQRKEKRGAGPRGSKSNTSISESKRPSLPIRCVSPPAPDIKRVIKFIVPNDYYDHLSKHERTSKTITTGTKKLQELYKTFERKVLNASTKGNGSKDLPSDFRESSNKISKDTNDKNEDVGFELESLDGSEFDMDMDETKPGGEYTADSFAANDDSDDSDDERNDDNVSDVSSDEEVQGNPETSVKEVRQRKLSDPRRLHPDLWFNEKGEGNDGPVCKCCAKDKEHGIKHAIYPGEKDIPLCNPIGNNAHKLYHYWVTVTPHSNFMTDRPSIIRHKDREYVFEGFSIISHQSLDKIPLSSLIRFNIEYSIHLIKEPLPKNLCIKGLELFSKFLFSNILELWDWTVKGQDKKGCPIFHFLPRFIFRREDQQDGKEIHELLSMDKVLSHLIKSSSEELIKPHHLTIPRHKERSFAKAHYNNIVTRPNKKPAAFRIDDILFDSENENVGKRAYPLVLHHSIRPVQMSYSGNPKYQKLWKSYIRLRNTLANRPVTSRKDHDRLVEIKIELERMRLKSSMRRDVEVTMSSQGLKKTGINSDICQHAMVLPVLVHHLRYHMCLKSLDDKLGYKFKDRTLLQLALTHPSCYLNFGMNPDQARNTLTNCGVKQPRYGDRRIHRMNTKKKGITQLIRIMANLGKIEENQSMIRHNERLEFLGDAVLEFICSSHLFYMLPDKNEGHLAMFRSSLVQNTHLAVLAKSFNVSDYMQYSHGPDLCKDEDLNHAMANCFEAIIGAVFLESGLKAATDLFTKMAFKEEDLRKVWVNIPRHPLQIQQPAGDRHLIPSSPVLQKLQMLEESTGITFTHIRLLARAFTHPQVGFNNLTLGDNQRMEFLGDSVLQLIVSIYLYRHFPEHHEGHLTLLRSSLVNNRTQADVARQLGFEKYINFGSKEIKNIREKLLADVLEAFLAALYIDKGLKHVEAFCRVCFFPRVEENIINQEWIDAKSQLQQCCLATREEGKIPDLPVYKVLQDAGPSHHKSFQVGVYYKGKRCGTGDGQSLHQAEMSAAKDALASSYFPEMARQKHFLDDKHQDKRTRRYEPPKPREDRPTEKTVQEPSWVDQE